MPLLLAPIPPCQNHRQDQTDLLTTQFDPKVVAKLQTEHGVNLPIIRVLLN